MKVALVHDDLVQWGGAERVLVAISEIFPEAPIFTSVFDRDNEILNQRFGRRWVITSFIQKIPGWQSLYKALLPLYPIAFEQFDFSGFDLVISQTTRFAKSVITKPETKHICYCHTPPRFLWGFSGQEVNPLLKSYLGYLKIYDQISSKRVDQWIAGSENARKRIAEIYQADSKVIYPFVDLERFKGIDSFDGGYLLTVSRLNKYKRIDLVVKAANELKLPLKVVGVGPESGNLAEIAGPTVQMLENVDEQLLTQLLAGCKTLVIAAEEDFGLTPLEAQIMGKPVVAFGRGGVLETVLEGTGFLCPDQTVDSLVRALLELDKKGYNEKKCREQARRFSKDTFVQNFQRLIKSL